MLPRTTISIHTTTTLNNTWSWFCALQLSCKIFGIGSGSKFRICVKSALKQENVKHLRIVHKVSAQIHVSDVHNFAIQEHEFLSSTYLHETGKGDEDALLTPGPILLRLIWSKATLASALLGIECKTKMRGADLCRQPCPSTESCGLLLMMNFCEPCPLSMRFWHRNNVM